MLKRATGAPLLYNAQDIERAARLRRMERVAARVLKGWVIRHADAAFDAKWQTVRVFVVTAPVWCDRAVSSTSLTEGRRDLSMEEIDDDLHFLGDEWQLSPLPSPRESEAKRGNIRARFASAKRVDRTPFMTLPGEGRAPSLTSRPLERVYDETADDVVQRSLTRVGIQEDAGW
jgi:hypothetical protein